MFKFLLIIFLISYVVYKLGGMLMRVFFAKAFQHQHAYNQQQHQAHRRKSTSGNVHIDYVPDDKSKSEGHMKGGEYVDYEDVKD